MKGTILTLVLLCASPSFAQQVPAPKTAAEVVAPADGITMTSEYAKSVARMAYVWGWPMVNMLNRSPRSRKLHILAC